MKRIGLCLCGTVIALMAGATLSDVYAQTGGNALFTYPMQGQTPAQEAADRNACHNWAVQQTGFDPSAVFVAQQWGVPQRTINQATRRVGTPAGGGIGGARGNREVRRINALYDDYLRAAQVCMEGRGYRVSR